MSHFFAFLSRMKLIKRWPLMRNIQVENIQEHSLQVAMIAHHLALIRNKKFGGDVDCNHVAVLGMYHDASEVITGDLPTPVKYFNEEIKQAFQAIEAQAEQSLLAMLPAEFQEDYRPLLQMQHNDMICRRLVKAADTLSAYLKVIEELTAGNHEFSRAKKYLEKKLTEFRQELPEVDYFIETYAPSFKLTLDELH